MRGDGCTSGLTETREDIDDARRETSLNDEFSCNESRERRLFSSLQYDDVSGSNSGTDLPSPHEQREVPWDDLTADTDGFMSSVSEGKVVSLNDFTMDFV